MVNERKYARGVIPGLVSLSQGTCYWPSCDEPIVRFVDGLPINNFEIAHIRAINNGGPRWVDGLDQEQLNSFDNLVLLCLVHHKIVDKIRPHDFSIEILQDWKTAREASGQASLRGLRGVTEERLQEMIAESFLTVRTQIQDAIGRLEAVDLEAANLLRPLIDELAEARINAYFPNEDVATMLASAGHNLANLEDAAAILATAADKLTNLEDSAGMLASAAENLSGLEDAAASLDAAARRALEAQEMM
jgi:hypothetical protein